MTPFFNNSNIQAWHCSAFKAIYDGTDGTYDQNWIIGVYTPDLCFELYAYRSDTWATLYKTGFTVRGNGYMAHGTDGTPHMKSDEGKFTVMDLWGGSQIGMYTHSTLAQIGDNTPHFLYHIPNFTMFTDIDGQSRPNYSMYGQFPQSNGSTPSISVTTEKSPRTSYIDTAGRPGLASYAQFGYGSLHIFYISMLSML